MLDPNKYEPIEFWQYTTKMKSASGRPTGQKIKRIGAKIGEYLAIAFKDKNKPELGYQIFRTDIGYPFISTVFSKDLDAVEFAEFLDKTYQAWWIVWEEYLYADIPSLTKWSTELWLFELLELMKDIRIKDLRTDLPPLVQQAKEKAKKWYRWIK